MPGVCPVGPASKPGGIECQFSNACCPVSALPASSWRALIEPAIAADKVSLFKVITAKDEIVIGISEDDLAQVDGRNAGGVARMLVARGSMRV